MPPITPREGKVTLEQRLNSILTEYKNMERDFLLWMGEKSEVEDPRQTRDSLIERYKGLQAYFTELEHQEISEDAKFRMELVDDIFSGLL